MSCQIALSQLVRDPEIRGFVYVGIANTVLTFVVFTTLLEVVETHYLVALGVTWVVGSFFSYSANFILVFKPEDKLRFGARFIRFLSAQSTSAILNGISLTYLVEAVRVDPLYAQLMLLPPLVVFNFLSTKFWSLKK